MNVSRRIALSVSILLPILLSAGPRDFNRIPFFWKWLSEKEVAFTYDGTFTDEDAFSVIVRVGKIDHLSVASHKHHSGQNRRKNNFLNHVCSPSFRLP